MIFKQYHFVMLDGNSQILLKCSRITNDFYQHCHRIVKIHEHFLTVMGDQRQTPAAFTSEIDPVPTVQEAGRPRGRFRWVQKISSPPEFEPASSTPNDSLYRLRTAAVITTRLE